MPKHQKDKGNTVKKTYIHKYIIVIEYMYTYVNTNSMNWNKQKNRLLQRESTEAKKYKLVCWCLCVWVRLTFWVETFTNDVKEIQRGREKRKTKPTCT